MENPMDKGAHTILYENDLKGLDRICTAIAGFRVQSANRYTTRPVSILTLVFFLSIRLPHKFIFCSTCFCLCRLLVPGNVSLASKFFSTCKCKCTQIPPEQHDRVFITQIAFLCICMARSWRNDIAGFRVKNVNLYATRQVSSMSFTIWPVMQFPLVIPFVCNITFSWVNRLRQKSVASGYNLLLDSICKCEGGNPLNNESANLLHIQICYPYTWVHRSAIV
jgi:hypothetical protein